MSDISNKISPMMEEFKRLRDEEGVSMLRLYNDYDLNIKRGETAFFSENGFPIYELITKEGGREYIKQYDALCSTAFNEVLEAYK